MNNTNELSNITKVIFSSRSTVDIYFNNKIVRASGELCCYYFLAYPGMFYIEEEDTKEWPWKLEEIRKQNILTMEEENKVISIVRDYYKNKKEPIIFLTKDIEDYSYELANKVYQKEISKRKAIRLLKKEFPIYPRSFYTDEITYSCDMFKKERYNNDEISR